MREGVRTLTGALADGTDSAFEQICAEVPVLGSLPEEDRPRLMESISDLVATISARPPEQETRAALQGEQDLFVPWLWTAEEWAFNASVHRLSTALNGDGPEIEPPPEAKGSEGGSEDHRWVIRALDTDALEAWEAVASKLPDAMAQIVADLRSDPSRSALLRKPLRGQLGRVTINDRALEHWQARCRGRRRRGKSTKKDTKRTVSVRLGNAQVAVTFEARVNYAVDARESTVWVTDAHLFKNDLQSREWVPVTLGRS
jgi:hypothetical protein